MYALRWRPSSQAPPNGESSKWTGAGLRKCAQDFTSHVFFKRLSFINKCVIYSLSRLRLCIRNTTRSPLFSRASLVENDVYDNRTIKKKNITYYSETTEIYDSLTSRDSTDDSLGGLSYGTEPHVCCRVERRESPQGRGELAGLYGSIISNIVLAQGTPWGQGRTVI